MKVIENKHEKINLCFADLPIGHAYRDIDGYLCIKTNHDENDCSVPNCIALVGVHWAPYAERMEALVTPVEATLTVDGRRYVAM